jgi:hypothetical protein
LKIKKLDLILIAILVFVIFSFMPGKKSGDKKLFLIDGENRKEIPLENNLIKLKDDNVLLEITEKGGRFIESDCPNRICITSGWVDSCGEAAVCVPNKYALVMECREQKYDAVSQ